ncbi:MAG TPA: hypothetical protein VME46_23630 [Acidimicrobiales bacterium]|nr:hypothetical protein [Acidimicrobiales bacterium]
MRDQSADEIRAGYEALRAAATGQGPCNTPRGLALFLSQGLPAWMLSWTPPAPPCPVVPVGQRAVTTGAGAEVVRVLTEMALGCSPRVVRS